MEAFGDQFLARPALSDHQHRALQGRRAAGPLDSVEESERLPDELIVPLHAPQYSAEAQGLAIITNMSFVEFWRNAGFPPFPQFGTPVAIS